jgi:hypothetical protein
VSEQQGPESSRPVPSAPPAAGPPGVSGPGRPDAVPPPGWPRVPNAWAGPPAPAPSSLSGPPSPSPWAAPSPWPGQPSVPPSSAPPSSGAPWRALAPSDRPADRTRSSRAAAPRPIYREPLPARASSVVIGVGAGGLWMLLLGLLGAGAASYCWWTIGAALAAWVASAILARLGDRGVAAGAAISAAVGLTIAMAVVVVHWIGGDWLLW